MLPLSSPSREAQLTTISLVASDSQVSQAERVLNAQELSRANRFVHADVRRRFIICRSRLRHLLAQKLGIEPAQVAFRYERWGKPQLDHPGQPDWHFNVSHSADWAMIVLAQVPVGVDLEARNPRMQFRAIASQILNDRERSIWQKLPPPQQEINTWRLWVCKEALLKAMGLGIAEGLRQVSLPLPLPSHGQPFPPEYIDGALQMHLEDDGTCQQNHWIDSRAWRLQLLDAPTDHQAVDHQAVEYQAAVCLPAGVQLVRS